MFRLEKRVAEMCNLSEGIERRGEKRGELRGREIGERLGQERGDKEGRKALSSWYSSSRNMRSTSSFLPSCISF